LGVILSTSVSMSKMEFNLLSFLQTKKLKKKVLLGLNMESCSIFCVIMKVKQTTETHVNKAKK